MKVEQITSLHDVLRELQKRMNRIQCSEGEENCKATFEDFDDWCETCVLETAVYFINQLYAQNTELINLMEQANANRQANQGITKISP